MLFTWSLLDFRSNTIDGTKHRLGKEGERGRNGGGLREQKGMEREQMSERLKIGSEKINKSLIDENKEQGCDRYATHFLSVKADKRNRTLLETRHHQ